jgi:hypothetical protein
MTSLHDETREPSGSADNAAQSRRRAAIHRLVVPLILLAGAAPFFYCLTFWPHTRDARLWIQNGQLSGSEWIDWVFQTQHFSVSYRPLTAISFTLSNMLGGTTDTTVHRVTDLLLHLCTAALVCGLYRRLVPSWPRWGGALAAWLFLAHPIVELIVPNLARRSYPLAMALGLAALVLLPRPTAKSWRGIVAALSSGILLGMALLANETAALLAAMVPFVLSNDRQWRLSSMPRIAWHSLLAWLPLLAAIWLRSTVVTAVGGYDYETAASPMAIVLATWSTLACLRPELIAARETAPVVIGLGLLGLLYAGMAIAAWRDRSAPASGAMFVPLVWLVGYTVLFSQLGVWFARQTYPLLIPLALLVALAAVWTLRGGTLRRVLLLPQAVLIAWITWHGPLLHRSDAAAVSVAEEQTLRAVHAYARGLTGRGELLVRLVLPRYTSESHYPKYRVHDKERVLGYRTGARWVSVVLDDPSIELENYLTYQCTPEDRGKVARLVDVGERVALEIEPGVFLPIWGGRVANRTTSEKTRIWLDEVARGADVLVYVFADDGTRQVRRSARPVTPD